MSAEERRTRKIDFGFLVQIVTVAGALYVIFAKPAKWDRACSDISDMKPQIVKIDSRVTIVETRLVDQNDRILEELRDINKKIGR